MTPAATHGVNRKRPFWAPLVLCGAGALIIGYFAAPDFDEESAADFSQMFGTCAQVVAALLVVIAVEVSVTTFKGLDLRTRTIKAGLASGATALVAAVAGTSPSLSDTLYACCFSIAVVGGLGSLAAVLLLGWKAIDQAHKGAELLATRRLAELGDSASIEELAKLGEPLPATPTPSRPDSPPQPVA